MSEFPDDPVMLRDKALLEFMYATGARVSEACGANLDDVDVDGRIARLMGKGSKQRLFPSAAMRAKRSSGICMRGVLSWNPNRKVPWNGVPYF